MIRWTIRFKQPDEHGCCIQLKGYEQDPHGISEQEKLVCGVVITRETAEELGVLLITAAKDMDCVYFDPAADSDTVRCPCLDLYPDTPGPHHPNCGWKNA